MHSMIAAGLGLRKSRSVPPLHAAVEQTVISDYLDSRMACMHLHSLPIGRHVAQWRQLSPQRLQPGGQIARQARRWRPQRASKPDWVRWEAACVSLLSKVCFLCSWQRRQSPARNNRSGVCPAAAGSWNSTRSMMRRWGGCWRGRGVTPTRSSRRQARQQHRAQQACAICTTGARSREAYAECFLEGETVVQALGARGCSIQSQMAASGADQPSGLCAAAARRCH